MLKLIFRVPTVFLFVLGVGNRLWEIYDRYSCLEILGPVWAMSRHVSNFQSLNINSMVRYNDRTAERIKADFTVGNHGRAKPALKCCINAWVVVLYYNKVERKLAWKCKMSGQSNYLPACLKIFSYDVMFADVILTLILNFWISQIFCFFRKDLITGSLKLKKFLQCLIYDLRYRSLNSDKFVKQKLEPPLRQTTQNLTVFLLNCPCYLIFI